MRIRKMRFVLFAPPEGVSNSSYASTHQNLARGLSAHGHKVLLLESQRSYRGISDLERCFKNQVKEAEFVLFGSHLPGGSAIAEWLFATTHGAVGFYDTDTPATLARLDRGEIEYVNRRLIPRFELYLSSVGGPILGHIEERYGAKHARAFYGSIDPTQIFGDHLPPRWDLGYTGPCSGDCRPVLEGLLVEPARKHVRGRFMVAGQPAPGGRPWPANIECIQPPAPGSHRAIYNVQRFALNVTPRDRFRAGFCPSVGLFEAAACGVPVITDFWRGMDEFMEPRNEILVAHSPEDTLDYLLRLREPERRRIGQMARLRVLAEHTIERRSEQLEYYAQELVGTGRTATPSAHQTLSGYAN